MKWKSFCETKEAVKSTKQKHSEFEKILNKPKTNRGLISKIRKGLKKLDSNTSNYLIKTWGTELNRKVSIEESQMAKTHLKKYPKSLVIRKMQVQMAFIFYLMPVRMAKIKKLR